MGTIWSDFKPQIEKLNKNKFVVVAFDPPGYGLSRPPKRNFSLDFYEKDADMAYDFMKVMSVLKKNRVCIIKNDVTAGNRRRQIFLVRME